MGQDWGAGEDRAVRAEGAAVRAGGREGRGVRGPERLPGAAGVLTSNCWLSWYVLHTSKRSRKDQEMLVGPISSDSTEGDVETQVVIPLLTRPELLGIPLSRVKSKEFLAAQDIGKGQKTKKGYIPDFCIYELSLPTLVIEVKSPKVLVAEAWEEATLYAHAINKNFPPRVNPTQKAFATNGIDYLAGDWDAAPLARGSIQELTTGSGKLKELQNTIGHQELERLSELVSAAMKLRGFKRPSSQGNGPALITSKLEPNTFAADLAPILRRYFSSRDQNKDPEIYKNAYVSSNEVTSYDRILESYLRDRLARSRTKVRTTKKRAVEVSKRINEFAKYRPQSGDLQLVTGGVGAGKSLFARRYKEYLQPRELVGRTHWSFIDFNYAPENLSEASEWICKAFVDSLFDEGAPANPLDASDQERIFSDNLQERSSFYQRMETIERGRGELERARDIEAWRQNPLQLAPGISRYLQGNRGEIIIAVFDNVDRRDAENQLSAFQMALWFMNLTRCLLILQMRDVTFEAFKNEKPLDTYRTGQIFFISPPRFIDVVKRRLELSLKALAREAPNTVRYKTASGTTIAYPKSRAGEFLRDIYLELFQKLTNVSRVLEALAGRNVRKALDMFMAIITSGHMPENLITIFASGNGIGSFPENLVVRILMRQDYRFFNDNSGFVANIFYCDRNWARPSNFLLVEALFLLIDQRKEKGDNGQLGFVSMSRLKDELENMGFVRSDIEEAIRFGLKYELIEADSSIATTIGDADCMKATASGWAHMRILSSRLEYVSAVLPTTLLNNDNLCARIFDLMQSENRFGHLYLSQQLQLVEEFYTYLQEQYNTLKLHPGYAKRPASGARYILDKVAEAVNVARRPQVGGGRADLLDS